MPDMQVASDRGQRDDNHRGVDPCYRRPHDHRRYHPPALRGAIAEQSARAGPVSRAELARLSPRLRCHEPDLRVGPGGMLRAGGLATAVPPVLGQGEDDALVDGTAFQLAVGLGGLLHGHGFMRAQPEPAVGE